MSFRLRERLGPADAVTMGNALVGFLAALVAFTDPHLAARLVLLAVIVDALDGIVARHAEETEVGGLLDSITDVVSFGATPGILVFGVVRGSWGDPLALGPLRSALVVLAVASYPLLSVLRTALYEVFVEADEWRPGKPNALGAAILAAAHLTGVVPAIVLLAATPVLAVLMVAPVRYPKLAVRDALGLGIVQGLAVLVPDVGGGVFPGALLVAALAYLTLAPRFYWLESPPAAD